MQFVSFCLLFLFHRFVGVLGVLSQPICRVNNYGFYWDFYLTEYNDSFSLLNEDTVGNCSVEFTTPATCINDYYSQTSSCGILTYLQRIQFKTNAISCEKTFHLLTQSHDKNVTQKLLYSFNFTFDACHLAQCTDAVSLAKLNRFETKRVDGALNSIIVKYTPPFSSDIEWYKVTPTIQITNIHNKDDVQMFSIAETPSSVYIVNDTCATYNVCVISSWHACRNRAVKEFDYADCTNISMYQPSNVEKITFQCKFLPHQKKVEMSLLGRTAIIRYLKLNVSQGRQTFSYNMTSIADFQEPSLDPSKSLSISLMFCDRCTCFDTATHECTNVPQDSGSVSKVLAAALITISFLLIVIVLATAAIFYKRRLSQLSTDDNSNEVFTQPRPVNQYHYPLEAIPSYDKLCIGDHEFICHSY